MLTPITEITIQQMPTEDYPDRIRVIVLDFMTEGEINTTWENLTDTAKITFPQNIYFTDDKGRKVTWSGINMIAGDNTTPVIMRGDKIFIDLGYTYFDQTGKQVTDVAQVFEGYVSKVANRLPIEIEAEDSMYLLKQKTCPNKVFKGYTLSAMLKELVEGTGIVVNDSINTSIGDFRTQDSETVAQVIYRLRKDYSIQGYIRNQYELINGGGFASSPELRCSGITYYSDTMKEKIFSFQENIVEDDLQYSRTDDLKIGIKAYSINKVELTQTSSTGRKKKKTERLLVFVTSKGITSEAGYEGEKRTIYFPDINSVEELASAAKQRLNRLFYEGFTGKFKTFGIPRMTHGNIAVLRDEVIPEREGKYFVKGVKTTFGMDGLFQEIEVDIRADKISNTDLLAGI